MSADRVRSVLRELGGEAEEHSVATPNSIIDALGVVDCLGILQTCGKPLCRPGHHHPLCALARRRNKPTSGLNLAPDALSGSGKN